MGTGCDDSDRLTKLVAGISQRLVLDQNHLPQRKLATNEIGQVPIRQVAFAPDYIRVRFHDHLTRRSFASVKRGFADLDAHLPGIEV